jgi:hypothetical protein
MGRFGCAGSASQNFEAELPHRRPQNAAPKKYKFEQIIKTRRFSLILRKLAQVLQIFLNPN